MSGDSRTQGLVDVEGWMDDQALPLPHDNSQLSDATLWGVGIAVLGLVCSRSIISQPNF